MFLLYTEYKNSTHKRTHKQTLHITLPVIGDLELENKLILWHFRLLCFYTMAAMYNTHQRIHNNYIYDLFTWRTKNRVHTICSHQIKKPAIIGVGLPILGITLTKKYFKGEKHLREEK